LGEARNGSHFCYALSGIDGTEIDLDAECRRLTLRALGRSVLGLDLDDHSDAIAEPLRVAVEYVTDRAVPCARREARSTRNTAPAPSRRRRTAGSRPVVRRGVSTSDKWWSGWPCPATLLWSKVTAGFPWPGIWLRPGSKAYCSGCLEPGSRLVGHTTGA
jgi:hypothetical protein